MTLKHFQFDNILLKKKKQNTAGRGVSKAMVKTP
jgi:hypothetical protein